MDSRIDVSNFFGDYLSNGKVEAANTWKRIERLEDKLDVRRAENRDLHQHLADFFVAESSNGVTNYVHLKKKLDSTFREINRLEAKLKRVRINVNVEREQMQIDMENKLKADEEREVETLHLLHEEIENRNIQHKQNVEHLNNELQLVQVTIDLEQDEMETKLRRELIDLNSKIWRQQNVTKEVQIKIDELERRQQATMKPNDYAPSLEEQLHFFQLNQLHDFFEKESEEKSTINKEILDNTEPNINKNQVQPDPIQQTNMRPQTLTFSQNIAEKIEQPQLMKSNFPYPNPNIPTPVQYNGHNAVYKTNQMISNEYKILRKPDCRGETRDKNPKNNHIHKDTYISSKEPDGKCVENYYTNQLTKKFSTSSSSSFTAKSDKGSRVREPKESIQLSRQHSKSEDNHEIIPKWTGESNNTRKIRTETGNYSSPNPLPAQKKSDPPKVSMLAANNRSIQTTDRNALKKRKLFNVNNLDYLEQLIPQNE